MPRFQDTDMEEVKLPGASFGYSAARLDTLGSSEYTVVDIVVDTSGSVQPYKSDLEKALQQVVLACQNSPRADNLMIRLTQFNDRTREIHGYKPPQDINPNDYQGTLKPYGCTSLYDASEHAVRANANYCKDLMDNDFAVNSLLVVISDGLDNNSVATPNTVGVALAEPVKNEVTESMLSILIGVGVKGDPDVSRALVMFKDEAQFTQYVETDNADAKTLAKLAEFVSKSISAQSSSLGSGGHSVPLSLSI